MWIDLRDQFLQSNAPRIFQIKRLLTDLHQGSMNISAYHTRLRTLWDELKDFQPIAPCHCGSMKQLVNFQNQECVLQFLMGLNDSYAPIRAQILMLDPLPIISKVFSLVIQEERQRSIHQNLSQITVVHSSSATTTKSSSSFNPKGGKFDKPSRNDKLICSHCHYTGHTVDKCYKLHGFPPGHPRFQQQQSRGHINAVNAPHDGVHVPRADASGQSTSQLGDSFTASQCQQLFTFLTAQLRLGSVSAQDQQQEEPSCHASMDPETKKVIGMGRRIGNLYVLTDSTVMSTPTVCKVSSNKTDLWHFRMGHPSLTKLSVVGHELHFHPIVNDVTHCSICHLSKQK
ncbi:uncharacterized protein [Primulina eburnea]|uniref:uncharacterized protein n=1 Tax=Primulina eburnea TaxID=1245227 RepID=UPI003C6BEB75